MLPQNFRMRPEMVNLRSGEAIGPRKKGPNRYGNPYKHSVKLVTSEEDLVDLNMAALEAYRIKLANFRSDVNKPEESKLGLLEKLNSTTKTLNCNS